MRGLDDPLLCAPGSGGAAAAIIHPDATNDEAVSEPPAARGRGPAAFKATYDWLHAAFEDLRWEVRELVAEGDLVRSAVARRRLGRAGQSSSTVPPVRQ